MAPQISLFASYNLLQDEYLFLQDNYICTFLLSLQFQGMAFQSQFLKLRLSLKPSYGTLHNMAFTQLTFSCRKYVLVNNFPSNVFLIRVTVVT